VAAHRNSPYVTVTRALLTGGATLALARVYSGATWIAPLLLAAALPAAILALGETRRWNPLVTTAVTAVVGAWLAILVDVPGKTILGVPAAGAIAAAAHDIARSPHILRSAVVPVAPVGAALMLAVVATFVVSLAAELTARRLEAPIGAIGPSIALYVAISALGSGRWAPTTACYALVVIEYLVALQHSDMETRRTWFQSARHRRSQLVTGGAGAGALVVAVALALGPGLPGARADAWIKYRSLGSGKGSSVLNVLSPLVSVGAKLTGRESTREVFTVRTTEKNGNYWRVIALDRFQNDGWSLNSDRRSATKLPGPTGGPGTSLVTETFQLDQIDPDWLPAAYRPVQVDAPGSQVLLDSTSLFLDRPLAGLGYTVESEIANPAKSALEAVTDGDLEAMKADTSLPDDFSRRARSYAQDITHDAQTPYDKAIALMKTFQSPPFVYDPTVSLGTDAGALDKFLFSTHHGFCEQYAAAFAELARSIGLPTRVAVGYQRGTLQGDGLWHVEERDAHAWPEVWLGPTVGWFRFEPTPGRVDPVTGYGSLAPGGPAGATTTTTPTTTNPSTPTTVSTALRPTPNQVNVQPPSTPTPPSHTRDHIVTGIVVTLVAVVAALLILAAALAFGAWRRTRRRRCDPDDRRRVLGAWTEALERLAGAGIERRLSTTSLEFALRQAPALGAGAAGPPLMSLARLHTAAMYSPDSPSAIEADEAWLEVDAITAALRSSVPLSRRLRSRWWSLRGRRRRKSADTADATEEGLSPER
jgi:transglutaminase-like putative cysteine protease